jgi:hypothetical protein
MSPYHPTEPFPNRAGKVSLGASSPIRRVVSHRLQSAVTGRSSDERNQRGWPISVIWRRYGDRPDQQPMVAVLITV